MVYFHKGQHYHVYDYELDSFTGITTYHGLVRIFNSKYWIGRLFWILIVSASFLLFVIHAYALLSIFHGKPTTTEITFEISEHGVEFPDITICNFNPVASSKLGKWNMTNDVLTYVMLSYMQVESLFANYDAADLNAWARAFESYSQDYFEKQNRNFSLRNFFIESGHTCEEMVISCSFAGVKIPNCCSHAEAIMTDVGKCIRFGGFGENPAMQRQMISGAFYGLHILLDICTYEISEWLPDIYIDVGAKFYVHPKGILPFLSSKGVAVPPGKKAYGAVSVRNLSLLPKDDWGLCQKNWDLVKHSSIFLNNTAYTTSNCEAHCIAHRFLDKCSCVPLSYQVNEDMPVCTPIELYNCINKTKMSTSISDEEAETYWYTECGCAVECDRLEYNVAMSYSDIPAGVVGKRLEHIFKRNHSYIKNNLMLLNVYMGEMAYERHVQRKSIDRVGLLSNIGGSMGLFLGMSIVTLAEIFMVLFKLALAVAYPARRRRMETRELCTWTANGRLATEQMLEGQENGSFDAAEGPRFTYASAFDAPRVLVTDYDAVYNKPECWKTADSAVGRSVSFQRTIVPKMSRQRSVTYSEM